LAVSRSFIWPSGRNTFKVAEACFQAASILHVKTTWQNLAKCPVEKARNDEVWDDATILNYNLTQNRMMYDESV
jgi:hypothetical protein